jgi:hypothetical protein
MFAQLIVLALVFAMASAFAPVAKFGRSMM